MSMLQEYVKEMQPLNNSSRNLSYDHSQLKILVIDDDPVVVKLATKYLKPDGYNVETASNGEIGWQMILKSQPDLIISDWTMPDISGVVLCQRVKANSDYPNLKISYFILLTAHSDVNYRVLGLDAGADEFLTKPVDPYELRARVRAGLRISLMAKSLATANQRLMARNELLASLSLTDQLTGLLNRRAMDQGLPRLLQSLKGTARKGIDHSFLSLLMIDIDHFKRVNDTYGHLVGDQVLKAIAGRLQNTCYPESLLYRYGGEEFICVTPDLNYAQSSNLADLLRKSISARPILVNDDLLLSITISVGGAIADKTNHNDPHSLVKRGDLALYHAKHHGRNCIQMFDDIN